jgi:hypothetical protein
MYVNFCLRRCGETPGTSRRSCIGRSCASTELGRSLGCALRSRFGPHPHLRYPPTHTHMFSSTARALLQVAAVNFSLRFSVCMGSLPLSLVFWLMTCALAITHLGPVTRRLSRPLTVFWQHRPVSKSAGCSSVEGRTCEGSLPFLPHITRYHENFRAIPLSAVATIHAHKCGIYDECDWDHRTPGPLKAAWCFQAFSATESADAFCLACVCGVASVAKRLPRGIQGPVRSLGGPQS